MVFAMEVGVEDAARGADGGHTPGAKAHFCCGPMRPRAKALGYLFVDRLLASGAIGVGGGEGGEVVFAEEVRGGFLHAGEVEWPAAVPDVGREEGWADAVGVWRDPLIARRDAR